MNALALFKEASSPVNLWTVALVAGGLYLTFNAPARTALFNAAHAVASGVSGAAAHIWAGITHKTPPNTGTTPPPPIVKDPPTP